MAGKAGWIPMIERALSHYRIGEKISAQEMCVANKARTP
jgi:hypothetical protein